MLTVMVGVGIGCHDAPPPSPWRVQLTGSVADTVQAGETWSYFDAGHAPRWRVDPSPAGTAWLELEGQGGRSADRVEATIEPRGAFGIVRTATRSAVGRYRARLRLDERVVWQGNLQDILQNHLGADVVVLNGCTTGATSRGYGVGLPEAFLLQGTRAVLATIEPVADDASTRFVARFTAAEPTKNPAGAFRAAVIASVEAKDDVWRRYRLWAR